MSDTVPSKEAMLQAAVDGELDPSQAARFVELCEGDGELAERFAQLKVLRSAMRENLPKDAVPEGLHRRIESMAELRSDAARPALRLSRWRPLRLAMAASLALAFGLGGTFTYFFKDMSGSDLEQSLMADHRRGLIAATPVDVVSTDRHTVKPWFDQHLALSPLVPDLASAGAELVGGRADVIGANPVPTLVYRIREHMISVTAVPAGRAAGQAGELSADGYELISWRQGDFVYFAVSDIVASDLSAFVTAFRQASAAESGR